MNVNKQIQWKATREEHGLIKQLAERASKTWPAYDYMSAFMDLEACHSNGCPMDFAGLLGATGYDFAHDMLGIRRHIDRATGELGDCFVPRFALANRTPVNA